MKQCLFIQGIKVTKNKMFNQNKTYRQTTTKVCLTFFSHISHGSENQRKHDEI